MGERGISVLNHLSHFEGRFCGPQRRGGALYVGAGANLGRYGCIPPPPRLTGSQASEVPPVALPASAFAARVCPAWSLACRGGPVGGAAVAPETRPGLRAAAAFRPWSPKASGRAVGQPCGVKLGDHAVRHFPLLWPHWPVPALLAPVPALLAKQDGRTARAAVAMGWSLFHHIFTRQQVDSRWFWLTRATALAVQ